MIPADPKPRFDIFSHLPDVLKTHTLQYIGESSIFDETLEKMREVSKNYLYEILRIPMDHSGKKSIYSKALRRIEEKLPHLSKYQKSIYCLRAVNNLLEKAKYYVSSDPTSVSVSAYTHSQRIQLAETISYYRQQALIEFFKELVMQLPFGANQLTVSEDQSLENQVKEIRALLPTIQKEIAEVGDQLTFVDNTLYPVEACQLFPLFDDIQKMHFLKDLINLEQYEPIEKILAAYSKTPVQEKPAVLVMIYLCCIHNASPKLLQKIVSSIESAVKNEESEEPINNADYLKWLQQCVNACAKNSDVKLLKILFNFEGVEQLDSQAILTAVFEKDKQIPEKLEFLRNSPIQISADLIQFIVKELIKAEKSSALVEVLKFKEASTLPIEDIGAILDGCIAHYTSPIALKKMIGFEEFEFIIKKFPETKELLKQKIDHRLEQLKLLWNPQLRFKLEELSKRLNLESEAENVLAPPPVLRCKNS